jgi:hypothetical protein
MVVVGQIRPGIVVVPSGTRSPPKFLADDRVPDRAGKHPSDDLLKCWLMRSSSLPLPGSSKVA